MKSWWLLFSGALAMGGCSCDLEIDDCEFVGPPHFEVDGRSITGPLLFPARGGVAVRVGLRAGIGEQEPNVTLTGPFEVGELIARGPRTESRTLTLSSDVPGTGSIVATDACGRSARLEVESATFASTRVSTDLEDWTAALPAQLTANGISLLPDGMTFGVRFEMLDEAGRALAGSLPHWPDVTTFGGIRLRQTAGGDWYLAVVGPEGPASLTVAGAEAIFLHVSTGVDAERLEVWRNADPTPDWVRSWSAGTQVGEELVLEVGERVLVGLHPFDADGRLLLGIDVETEPFALGAGGEAFVLAGRGLLAGDGELVGLAPGETTVVAQKADAIRSLRVRVVEAAP